MLHVFDWQHGRVGSNKPIVPID